MVFAVSAAALFVPVIFNTAKREEADSLLVDAPGQLAFLPSLVAQISMTLLVCTSVHVAQLLPIAANSSSAHPAAMSALHLWAALAVADLGTGG